MDRFDRSDLDYVAAAHRGGTDWVYYSGGDEGLVRVIERSSETTFVRIRGAGPGVHRHGSAWYRLEIDGKPKEVYGREVFELEELQGRHLSYFDGRLFRVLRIELGAPPRVWVVEEAPIAQPFVVSQWWEVKHVVHFSKACP